MNTPHEPQDRDDGVLAAYRRASALEARGPDPGVRERVLAQVRRDHAPVAANDNHWSWRAAAGIAVVGLVGLLVTHGSRNPPRQTAAVANGTAAPIAAAPDADVTPAVATAESAVSSPPARRRKDPRRSVNPVVTADKTLAELEYRAATRPAPLTTDASAAAMRDRLIRSPAVDSAADNEYQVRRAVSARFSALYLPMNGARLNLVIVLMNGRGQIERAAVESVAARILLAGTRLVPKRFQQLELTADDIGASGFIQLSEKGSLAGEADRVLLVQYAWPRSSGPF